MSRGYFDGTITAFRVTDEIICSSSRQLIFRLEMKAKHQINNREKREWKMERRSDGSRSGPDRRTSDWTATARTDSILMARRLSAFSARGKAKRSEGKKKKKNKKEVIHKRRVCPHKPDTLPTPWCVYIQKSPFFPLSSHNCFETFFIDLGDVWKTVQEEEKRICSTSGKLHCVPDAGEAEDFLAEKFVPDLFVWEESKLN